jgi:hypothetical protein
VKKALPKKATTSKKPSTKKVLRDIQNNGIDSEIDVDQSSDEEISHRNPKTFEDESALPRLDKGKGVDEKYQAVEFFTFEILYAHLTRT